MRTRHGRRTILPTSQASCFPLGSRRARANAASWALPRAFRARVEHVLHLGFGTSPAAGSRRRSAALPSHHGLTNASHRSGSTRARLAPGCRHRWTGANACTGTSRASFTARGVDRARPQELLGERMVRAGPGRTDRSRRAIEQRGAGPMIPLHRSPGLEIPMTRSPAPHVVREHPSAFDDATANRRGRTRRAPFTAGMLRTSRRRQRAPSLAASFATPATSSSISLRERARRPRCSPRKNSGSAPRAAMSSTDIATQSMPIVSGARRAGR